MKIKTIMAKEVLRKSLHFIIGAFVIIFGLAIREKTEWHPIILFSLFILLAILMVIEYFRIDFKWDIPIYSRFIRDKESDRFNGMIYGLIATILIFTFLDYEIALAALAMAIFGDAIACLIGKHIGGPKIFKKKTFAGSFAAFIVNIIIGVILLNNIFVIIAMALIATFVEFSVDKIDDNLVVPLFTGLLGQIIVYILQFI